MRKRKWHKGRPTEEQKNKKLSGLRKASRSDKEKICNRKVELAEQEGQKKE